MMQYNIAACALFTWKNFRRCGFCSVSSQRIICFVSRPRAMRDAWAALPGFSGFPYAGVAWDHVIFEYCTSVHQRLNCTYISAQARLLWSEQNSYTMYLTLSCRACFHLLQQFLLDCVGPCNVVRIRAMAYGRRCSSLPRRLFL